MGTDDTTENELKLKAEDAETQRSETTEQDCGTLFLQKLDLIIHLLMDIRNNTRIPSRRENVSVYNQPRRRETKAY